MGARWYQPQDASFDARDTVFGETTSPSSLNRHTYALGNPLAHWDPDGRQAVCTGDIYMQQGLGDTATTLCTNDLKDAVQFASELNRDISEQFVANMREALQQTAVRVTDMALDLIPGGDCIRAASNYLHGSAIGLGNAAGCALDAVPVIGGAASTIVRYGDNAIEAIHDGARVATRADTPTAPRRQPTARPTDSPASASTSRGAGRSAAQDGLQPATWAHDSLAPRGRPLELANPATVNNAGAPIRSFATETDMTGSTQVTTR